MTDTIDITVFDEAGKFSSIPELNPELTVREVLEAAKSFLDLADSNASYFLTLEKTNKPLDNSYSLQQAGLQNNDRLILIKYEATEYQSHWTKQESPQKLQHSTIQYTLNLTISETSEKFQYSIKLAIEYENNPSKYFIKNNSEERYKFASSLKEATKKDFNQIVIDKILKFWCNEISIGYRETIYKI
jgi:hypothetical protein